MIVISPTLSTKIRNIQRGVNDTTDKTVCKLDTRQQIVFTALILTLTFQKRFYKRVCNGMKKLSHSVCLQHYFHLIEL